MRSTTLFVVLGAGASHAASSAYGRRDEIPFGSPVPPLVTGLFDTSFNEILKRYPMAQNASPEIRAATQTSVSLEDFLRKNYRDSDDEFDQRRLLSVQLYLQHLLWHVSHDPPHWDRLDRLATAATRAFEHVCFITLNYDLLLDKCLSAFNPIVTMKDYTRRPRWSLIKLHGSVDWGYRLYNAEPRDDHANPGVSLPDRLEKNTIYRSRERNDLQELRIGEDGHGSSFHIFPALSVPLGAQDEIVCPEEHLHFLRQRFASVEALDLLVIGYSAFDQAVLEQLRETGKPVRQLAVVNRDVEEARAVGQRVLQALDKPQRQGQTLRATEAFDEWTRETIDSWFQSWPG